LLLAGCTSQRQARISAVLGSGMTVAGTSLYIAYRSDEASEFPDVFIHSAGRFGAGVLLVVGVPFLIGGLIGMAAAPPPPAELPKYRPPQLGDQAGARAEVITKLQGGVLSKLLRRGSDLRPRRWKRGRRPRRSRRATAPGSSRSKPSPRRTPAIVRSSYGSIPP